MTGVSSTRPPRGGSRLQWVDLAPMIALVGVMLIRWRTYLLAARPLIDEQIYLEAFAAVANGASPYSVEGFFYPASFAWAGSLALSTTGEIWTVALLRAANILGLVATAWLSLKLWPSSWKKRLVAAAVFLTLAPAVHLALYYGNIACAVVGMIVIALSTWPRRPLIAGLVLGSSAAIKPFAPAAVLALVTHRPRHGGYRQVVAGLVGGLTMVVVLLPVSQAVAMSRQTIQGLIYKRSISLYRMLRELGLEMSPLAIALVITAIAVLLCRRFRMTEAELICFATTAALATVPIIWSHTFLLVLPVQVFALARAASRRRNSDGGTGSEWHRLLRRYEAVLVLLGVAAIQFSGGAGAFDNQPVPLRVMVLAVPYLAAPALTAYVLTTGRFRSDDSETSDSRSVHRGGSAVIPPRTR